MTDDNQTTPDTERAERLAEAREFASTARLSQFPPHTIGSLLLALDDEIERLSAVVSRQERYIEGLERVDEAGLRSEIERLTGLLAERDATVQRVQNLLPLTNPELIGAGYAVDAADILTALDPRRD